MGKGKTPLRRTATHFKDWIGDAAAAAATSKDESSLPLPAADSKLSFTQQVIRAIYVKWHAQSLRARAYRRMFMLVAFIVLLLGVLYSQRGAAVSFQVHSTIDGVVTPSGTAMQSVDGVYEWLQGVLQAVWQDPTCGDGLCETPFEFASYGRFGCRADCGTLIDLEQLTSLDIDLYYDFSHQPGSLPAAELMDQASWNLCPEKIQYNSDCYFQDDQTFSSISGSVHMTLPDIPDGTWTLSMKRDLLEKVKGAVRSAAGVEKASVWFKVYIAETGVAAEQQYEIGLLQTAVTAANTPLLDYLPTLWSITLAVGRDDFDAQQMRNATCLCGTGATSALDGTAGFVDEATFQSGSNCTGITQLSERIWYLNGTSSINTPATVDGTICAQALANMTSHRSTFNATMLNWLVTQRLGNLVTTGKIASRNTAIASLRGFLEVNYPELVDPIFATPSGNDAQGDPVNATVSALASLYVDSPLFLSGGPPAHLALFRRRLTQDPGMTFVEWGNRAAARIQEIAAQQSSVLGMALPNPGAPAFTAGSLMAAFTAAGANQTWLPAADTTALGPLAVPYNLVSWPGGQYEFISCNLANRAAEYVGTCQAKTVSCSPSSLDAVPYTCTTLADNATVAGNLSSSAYRETCEVPCDLELDCAALCDCGQSGCAAGEICICPSCRTLQGDAAADGEFMTIAAAATSSGSTAAVFAPINAATSGKRRALLSATNDDVISALAAVSGKVDTLRAAQDSITAQVNALQAKVDQANLLAEARAANTQVQDLITAGRADIATGQKTLESKLETLLQRQQAALDAALQATATLAAIQDLSQRQVSALSGLDAAVKEQVKSISVATQQGLISLATALSYWKVARRNRAAEAKVYRLANTPCNPTSVADNLFTVDNGNLVTNDTARDRSVGLNNRIVGGMLLHTWRSINQECPVTRFSTIQSTCTGALDVASYGVDPAFKAGTSSFQPDLIASDDGPMLQVYDCSGLDQVATYSVVEPATGLTVNPPPYCTQLFNSRNVPYGFHHFPLVGLPPGFPVWLDINLSQDGANTWLNWLRDALLLDASARGLTARFVTYNADLAVFASVKVEFDFGAGGSIQAASHIHALKMELYNVTSAADGARYAFEVLLSICVGVMLLAQLWDIILAAARPQGLRRYFSSPAHWVDSISNVLLVVCCIIWWIFAVKHARVWSMDLRYNVYNDLQPVANFLDLAGEGRGLVAAWAAIRGLEAAVNLVSWYYALSGINILLLLGRLLRRLDFQPRLGVITRSLRLALPDLLHFALVAGAVFVGYSMMAFVIFGNSVPQFSTFGSAVNACFGMMLGDFGDVFAQLKQLTGVQGVAGILFFWTYMLLVFLVLLNFLLAIIVDAFSEIKERTKESTSIHTELTRLIVDRWHDMLSLLPRGPARAGRQKLDALLRSWAGADVAGKATKVEEVDKKGEGSGEGEGGEGEVQADGEEGKQAAPGGRTLQVLGQALDEDTLCDVLSEALAPFDAADAAGGAKAKGEGAATAEEVSALAKFVLQRYGSRAAAEGQAGGSGEADGRESSLEAERDRLAAALEQLADVQRDLAEAQRQLMVGQKQLAEQQARLLGEEH